jgi:hypothetical protein
MTTIKIAGIEFTAAAAAVIEETGLSRAAIHADVASILSGERTEEQLLRDCQSGADADRLAGWVDYVSAIVGDAERA